MVSFALPRFHTDTQAQRNRLASGLEHLVRDARRPRPRAASATVPFREHAVRAAASELLALAAALRTMGDPSADAVARVRQLLMDPAGPVYVDTGEDLRQITQDILRDLEESPV